MAETLLYSRRPEGGNKMYKIYKHTLPDGRAYVGMTGAKKIYKRWQYGSGYVANKPFYNEILKFGWNNIQHEILEEVEDREEAKEREQYYIELFETYVPGKGFNIGGKNKAIHKQKFVVEIVETGQLFENQSAVAAWLGITRQAASYAIKNNSKVKKKYHLRLRKVESLEKK